MAKVTKPLALDETLKTVAKDSTLQDAAESIGKLAESMAEFVDYQKRQTAHYPIWDDAKGEFTNESIKAWLDSEADGIIYGVKQPKDARQVCIKTLGNAGIPNPVPSTLAQVGSDPYFGRGAFRYYNVNATVDDNGVYHVTGIDRFGGFVNDGTKDVFTLTPVRYERQTDTGDGYIELAFSDTPRNGLHREQRSADYTTGEPMPFMLRAKYAMSIDGSGKPWSITDAKPANRTVSQSNLGTTCAKKGTHYSGLTAADDAYLYDMFLMKYANKSSQSVFAGCTSHTEQVHPTMAESGVKRVVVAKSDADKWPVGAAFMLGKQTTATTDRQSAECYNVFDALRLTSKVAVDDSNTALYFSDTQETFDVSRDYLLSTAPWRTGACDGIVYDGSPTSPTSGREPFVLQGIETAFGAYEIIHDGMASNDGSGWVLGVANTMANVSTSAYTANYTTVCEMPKQTNDNWFWPLSSAKVGGAYTPVGTGGSATSGVGDGIYLNKIATTGTREVLSRGYLDIGSAAGLRCVALSGGLGAAGWFVCSRLSLNGRNGVNFAD